MTPKKEMELNEELNQVYEQLSELNARQRELNRERDTLEGDRNVILVELGRIGIGWMYRELQLPLARR